MNETLAIFDTPDNDELVLQALAEAMPARVLVMLEAPPYVQLDADDPRSDAHRARLAELLAAVEQVTGATVAGVLAAEDDWERMPVVFPPGVPAAA